MKKTKNILIIGLVLAAVLSIDFEKAIAATCSPNPSGQCNICCHGFHGNSFLNFYTGGDYGKKISELYGGGYINPAGTGIINTSGLTPGTYLAMTSSGKSKRKSMQVILSGYGCYIPPQYTKVTSVITYDDSDSDWDACFTCGVGTQSRILTSTITSSGGVCGEADSSVVRHGNQTCNMQACPPPPATYTLTTSATTGGLIIPFAPSGRPLQYNSGESVPLTAVPADGYSFSGWSGNVSGLANPTAITMDGNKSVVAKFIPTYTLTTSATTGGSISPSSGTYNSGATVSLTATPAAEYTFSEWSDDVSGSVNPTAITMDGNKSVVANFAINTYTLTTSATTGGSISPSGYTYYNSGESVLLTATPAAGYTFSGWSGDASGSTNPTTITMNGNKSVVANFIPTYTLTTSATTGGSISPSSGTYTYNYRTVVSLTATSAAGYTFSGWSGDVSDSTNPTTAITMNGNKSVVANFIPWIPPDPLNKSISPMNHGFRISWDAPDPAPASYKIYKSSNSSFANSISIQTTGMKTTERFFNDNRIQNPSSITDSNPFYYKIVSVSSIGQESPGVDVNTKGLGPIQNIVDPLIISGSGFIAGADITIVLIAADNSSERYSCGKFNYINSNKIEGSCNITETPTGIFDVEVTMISSGKTLQDVLHSGFRITYPAPVSPNVSIDSPDLTDGELIINSVFGDNLYTGAEVSLVVRDANKVVKKPCFNLGEFDYFTEKFSGGKCSPDQELFNEANGNYGKIKIEIANDKNSIATSISRDFSCAVSSWTPDSSIFCGTKTVITNCGTTESKTGILSCSSPNTCGGGGTANACGCAVSSYNPVLSAFCGIKSVTTNCNTTESKIGNLICAGYNTCGGGGITNACGCTPTTWTPNPSTVCSGISFTQNSNCGTSKSGVAGTMDKIWTPSPSTTVCPANSPLRQSSTNCVNPDTNVPVVFTQNTTQGTNCASGYVCQNSSCVTNTCKSFTYSDWSPPTCPANGQQTRTVTLSSPAGCIGGNPITSQSCTPTTCPVESDVAFCARLEKTCGSVTANDNCGTSRTASCGTCISPNTCAGGGVANICGCTPTWTPDPSTVSECTTLTQTSNCGATQTVEGTKNCSGLNACNNDDECTFLGF